MWRKNPHPIDEELLRAADGELSPREAAAMGLHMAACPSCCARLGEIQQTANDFVQAYRLDQNATPLAEDSRARLHILIKLRSQESARPRSSALVKWLASVAEPLANWRWAYASIAILLACSTFYFSPHFHRPITARTSVADSNRVLLVPIPNLTPGVAHPISASQACLAGPSDQMSTIPLSERQMVFHEYGMDDAQRGRYEVDHLITPELGGTDDIRNLWPEPYSSEWNARVKDQLEDHLREMVCKGKLDVGTAQRDIATNWISAYKKYFRTDTPHSSSRG